MIHDNAITEVTFVIDVLDFISSICKVHHATNGDP
jgi:hypothetical protein